MKEISCYMCERPKTSAEHVPPKCLFPEQKDCDDGENFRKNLIKVPSCDLHNSAKSCDDEFMLITFATNMISEDTGGIYQKSKLMRIVDRKPHVFAELLKNSTPVTLIDQNGSIKETCALHLDRKRFMTQMQSVANGIYFHHMSKKVTGKTEVVPIKGLSTTSSAVNVNNAKTREFAEKAFPNLEIKGDNPDIFYYQVTSDTPEMIMKLVFYRFIEFVVVFNIHS